MKKVNKFIQCAAILLGITLTGCANLTPTQSTRIEGGVKAAAQIGGGIALSEHPEWRVGFQEAVLDLGVIADTQGQVGFNQVLGIVQRLKVKELKSPTAQLSILGGMTLLDAFGKTELNPQTSDQVKAIARALHDGLVLALQFSFSAAPTSAPIEMPGVSP